MLAQLLVATLVVVGGSFAQQQFPYPLNEPYMIEAYGRGLVWEPQDGDLASGNPVVLSPRDPTKLTQFWISRYVGGFIRVANAAAPDYIFADWEGFEGFNATVKLSKQYEDTQVWFTYSGVDEQHFQINAMSELHYCVRGYGEGFPLNLVLCNSADAYPFHRWVMNRNYTIPTSA